MKPPFIHFIWEYPSKRYSIYSTCLLLLFLTPSKAQHVWFKSPTSGILGSSGALDKCSWAFYTNPAGLSELKGSVAGIGYQNDFHLKELSTRTAFVSFPFKAAIFSGGYTHSGFQHFYTQQFQLAFARNLAPWLNMGLRFNYHLRYQTGSKTSQLTTLDAGWQLAVSENIHMGFYALNPAQTQWRFVDANESQPVALAASVDYTPVSGLRLETGLVKEMDFPPSLSFLVDSQIHQAISVKGSATSSPLRFGLGTGILWQSITFDMGLMHHETLGLSSSFGILYHLAYNN